jgi:NAD(P)-dependent dehydrogenase (short-subunit alcohol dehydrogenase family)
MSRVLVTGAASGLGLALVRAFADRGDEVLATDRHPEPPATDSPDALPSGVAYRRLDVTRDDDWEDARAWVEAEWGGLDVLVNNAGVAVGGRIDRATMGQWERGIAVNLLGVARGCRTFVPVLKAQRSGRIVNIASLAGLVHGPGLAPYNAAKAGVVALSETLRYELAPFGITTSVVCPAFFRTNLPASMSGDDPAAERATQRLVETSPRSAEDVAAIVLAGMDAGRFVILTERQGRLGHWTKRVARPLYDRNFRKGAARLAYRELHGDEQHGDRP